MLMPSRLECSASCLCRLLGMRSLHRDEEDLLSDYDNVLNRPKSEAEEVSILVLKADTAMPVRVRDAYKLALRDSAKTVKNNIILAYQLMKYREYTL